MYARDIGDQVLTFGVSGKLVWNSLIMYDHQTGSLWSHLLGEALVGPLRGTRLEIITAQQTTWENWRQLHPDSLVLDNKGRYTVDVYQLYGYYSSPEAGILGEKRSDTRLFVKEYVIGLRFGDQAKAYPFSVLNQEPVVNDTFAGVPVLVVFDPESASGAVFDRRLGDRVLQFDVAESAAGTLPEVVDRQTGTRWAGLTGLAVEGQLKGQALRPIPTTYAFWFGWKDFYPETEVYLGERP